VVNASYVANRPTATGKEPALLAIKLSMGLGGVVLVLLMVFGLCMRIAQGGLLSMEPTLFYEIMTAHGAGMVGTAALTGAGIMWFFLSRHVQLTGAVYWLTLTLFLLGVALILGAIFVRNSTRSSNDGTGSASRVSRLRYLRSCSGWCPVQSIAPSLTRGMKCSSL